MVKRIIVPLDGSFRAEAVMPFARALARALECSIELVHAIDQPMYVDVPVAMIMPTPGVVHEYLEGVRVRHDFDVPVTTRIEYGAPADVLMDMARDERDVMIVLSTHGRGMVERVLLGSVADKVVRLSHVPVGLVRVTDHEQDVPDTLETILVALDGSTLAEQTLPIVTELARASAGKLHLVRAVEPLWTTAYASQPDGLGADPQQIAELMELLERDARDYLESTATRIREQGIPVEWTMRVGHPAMDTLTVAASVGADAIAVATHGRGGLRRMILGSVTSSLIHHSTLPLLIVPAQIVAEDEKIATAANRDAVAEKAGGTA